jgi:hypothetical protein
VIWLLEDTVYRGKKVALSSIKKMLEEVEKGKKCKIRLNEKFGGLNHYFFLIIQ